MYRPKVKIKPTNGRHAPTITGARPDLQSRAYQVAMTIGLLLSGFVQILITIGAVLRATWERGHDD